MGNKEFEYSADGLSTEHYTPFLDDEKFESAYCKAIYPLDPDEVNVRYRGYILKWAVSQVRGIEGNFVECGVYDAKAATLILNLENLKATKRKFFLIDTFSGIPQKGLTDREKDLGYEGQYADITLPQVKVKLKNYLDVVEFHEGVIPDVFEDLVLESVAFLHLDLNAAHPTKSSLDFFYPNLSAGGIIIFDDYGWEGYEDQRILVDKFFSDKPEEILVLPTGQGLVIKKPI